MQSRSISLVAVVAMLAFGLIGCSSSASSAGATSASSPTSATSGAAASASGAGETTTTSAASASTAVGTGLGDACTARALQAVVDAQGGDVKRLVEASTLKCADGWAVAEELIDDGVNKRDVTLVAQSQGGSWVIRSRSDACGAGELPAQLKTLACNSN